MTLLIVVLPLMENLALMEWISPGKDFELMKGFAQQVVVTVVDAASMFETEVHDLLAQVGRSVPHCILVDSLATASFFVFEY